MLAALVEGRFGDRRRAPAQSVAADRVGVWNLLEVEHAGLGVAREDGDGTVGASASEDKAVLGWRERDAVDGRVVVAVLVPFVPLAVRLLPHDDFPVVAAAR